MKLLPVVLPLYEYSVRAFYSFIMVAYGRWTLLCGPISRPLGSWRKGKAGAPYAVYSPAPYFTNSIS